MYDPETPEGKAYAEGYANGVLVGVQEGNERVMARLPADLRLEINDWLKANADDDGTLNPNV